MSAPLPASQAIRIFVTLALAYFLSTLMRTITATLSPTLVQDFALSASDLGLLAGGYYIGFASTQLPMGTALDRHGPQRVQLVFLTMAVVGCLLFAVADHFSVLLLARMLVGVGVSACLMAPLTGYRRWFSPGAQLRANSWMLMTGSLGMLASTLPVQWLLPLVGWRPILAGMAGLFVIAMLLIRWQVPAWHALAPSADGPAPQAVEQEASSGVLAAYRPVWRNATFQQLLPLGFFCYGGLLAMQTLWAAPWMMHVGGATPAQAAMGLFVINLAMLFTFWTWGLVNPWLTQRGWHAQRLMRWGVPLNLASIFVLALMGADTSVWHWVAFCMTASVVSVAQPAVGMAFDSRLAGRALSAFNLAIFLGGFALQWGYGLLIDALQGLGLTQLNAYRMALACFGLGCVWAYARFWRLGSHNQGHTQNTP